MIICDDREFVFIHIPKCAGTSVRRALRHLDTTGAAFFAIANHSAMGRVHLAHLTLADLAEHFPYVLSRVCRYRSVALVRDPVDRFYSAIFQRLREFREIPQSAIDAAMVEADAAKVIDYLERETGRLDLDHVHFNRQSDYLELHGERIVSEIFPLAEMAAAAQRIRDLTGADIGQERRNPTTELRFPILRPVQRLLRDQYVRLVPEDRRTRIRARMTLAGVYKQIPKDRFFERGGRVDQFIRDYYARDFAIIDSCNKSSVAQAA